MHLNRLSVFPRVCNTERTQMAIAAFSFAALLRVEPFRTFTVERTFLMQWQKDGARALGLILF